ncbi:MAG TPA: hypothetical protein GXX40_05725 [Firmicutes bacterium]|nr:hypothetical protein [Bacillota bacterium]
MARFGTGQFGSAKFGVEELSETQLSLLETLQKSFARSLADSISLSDVLLTALKKVVSELLALAESSVRDIGPSVADSFGLSDTAWQGFSTNLVDALTLSESVARLAAAVRADSVTLSDLLSASAMKVLSDALSLADACATGATLSKEDVLTLADGFSVAVAKALADTLALAEAISAVTGASRAESLVLADALALNVAKVLGDDPVTLADVWFRLFTTRVESNLAQGKPYTKSKAPSPSYPDTNHSEFTDGNEGDNWTSAFGYTAAILGIPDGAVGSVEIVVDLGSPATVSRVRVKTGGGSLSYRADQLDVEVSQDGVAFIPVGSTTQLIDTWYHEVGFEPVICQFVKFRVAKDFAPAGQPGDWLFIGEGWVYGEWAIDTIDNVAVATTKSASDLVELTDTLIKSASTSLSEMLALVEAMATTIQKVVDESANGTDSLQASTSKVLADVASLADVIRTVIDAYPGRSALFGLARFGYEYFGNQQPGEAVSLRDAIASEIGFGVLAEDLEVLADAIRSAVERLAAENPALLDAIASGLVAQRPDETALASDAVALQVARAVESLLAVSDALLSMASEKGITDTVAPVVDSLTSKATKVVELALALGDQAAAQVAKSLSGEAVALADAIAQTAGVQLEDIALDLGSVLQSADMSAAIGGARFGRSAFGSVSFGDKGTRAATTDDLAKAISTVLGDVISHLDALALQAIKTAALSMTLTEAVALVAQKVAADSASVVDLNTFAVAKSLGLSVAVADDVAKAVAIALQGLSVTTADQVQAALAMLRQAQDEMAIVDGVVRAINLLRDELVAVADEARKDIDAKRAETLAIASALGKDVAHFPPGDVTGLLDEVELLGALLAGDLMAPLMDAVTGEVYEVLSQVFINGISVLTRGLTIKESVASRVGECSFVIPDPTPQVLSLCQQGADVHVYLSDSGENIVWGGRIVSASVVSVSSLVREIRVTAQDYATRAQSVLVSGAWVQTKYTDTVKALWQQYAPEDNLVLEVTDNPKVAEKWVVKWESLAEATDKIAQVLGWTWRVDWDGGKKIFRFFDPGAEVHPRVLSVANLNIESGTAEFGQDEEIVNSVYVLGGQTLYTPDPYRKVADGQETYFILPARPFEPIAIKVDGVEKTWTYEVPYWPEGKDCMVNPEGRYVRFRTAPASGAVVEVTYQAMRPVRVHLEEPGSIALYGRHDRVVNDSKIADPLQARETARKILREKAWPKQHGTMNVYEPGLRAGKIVHVYLPDRGIDGLYQIAEMTWAVDRAVIKRSISLNRVADAGASIAQVIKALAERVAALEAGADSENATVDRFIDQSQRVKIAVNADWAGSIVAAPGADQYSAFDLATRVLRSGDVLTTWAEDVAREVGDLAACWAHVARGDASAVSYHAKISTARFGFARFGEAQAGTEVSG